jgi:hypothetical protein
VSSPKNEALSEEDVAALVKAVGVSGADSCVNRKVLAYFLDVDILSGGGTTRDYPWGHQPQSVGVSVPMSVRPPTRHSA